MTERERLHPIAKAAVIFIAALITVWLLASHTSMGMWAKEILGYRLTMGLIFVAPLSIAGIYLKNSLAQYKG